MLSSSWPEDTALRGRFARPSLLYPLGIAIGLVLDRVLPLPLALPAIPWSAGALVVTGLFIMTAGIRNFSSAATPVPGNQPVRTLVTSGIHGWSRNPIYVGMTLVYAGVGIAARSPWALILGLPVLLIVCFGVVPREEKYLEQRFGDAYRDYKARVRRWF